MPHLYRSCPTERAAGWLLHRLALPLSNETGLYRNAPLATRRCCLPLQISNCKCTDGHPTSPQGCLKNTLSASSVTQRGIWARKHIESSSGIFTPCDSFVTMLFHVANGRVKASVAAVASASLFAENKTPTTCPLHHQERW